MKRRRPSRDTVLLGLIVLLGTIVRFPGLFWGYRFFGTETVVLYRDEPSYSLGRGLTAGLPRGLSTQVALLGSLLSGLLHSVDWDFFGGRIVSLVYGVLTLVVVFRLGRTLFRDARVGLLAAFFLALADLHVTYSHIGIPDSAATFWFYAALASASTALARDRAPAAVLSAICSGAAAAMRFQLASLIPLAWWLARTRRRVASTLGILAVIVASFFVFDGLHFDRAPSLHRVADVAVWRDLGWKTLFLPGVYLAVIVVGVGLPVFLLAGYGLGRVIRAKLRAVRGGRALLADDQIPVALAPLLAFLQLAVAGLWAHHHAVVLVPAVAILAAHGFASLPGAAWGRIPAVWVTRGLVTALGVYLAVQVASVQTYFVDDPLERAGRWLRARVPAGEVLSKDHVSRVPPEYPTIPERKASYLILSARGSGRPRFRDFLPEPRSGRVVAPADIAAETIVAGNGEELVRMREAPRYRLARQFRLRFYTPELLLADAFWYPPPHLNSVLIYERVRERQARAELLTPLRTDYLVTLDTGRLWHLASGQEVEAHLNGRPLAVQLREGIVHVVVPRALIASPYSELSLSSPQPLPHLPPDFVARVRPLEREFVVESFLDGDLMPEGFYRPDIGLDGAVSRWSGPVGRILLPGPGSAEPWRRLAVRLRGRPAGSRPPQPVVLFLDGRKLGDVSLSGEDRVLEFPIPPNVPGRDLLSLEIVTAPWRPSVVEIASSDTRELGVAVYWLRLGRSAGFPRAAPAPPDGVPRGWQPLFGLGAHHRVETVSFPSGGLTLRADLYVPNGRTRSAILLAHGASPLGRKHGLYLELARRLAERGYWVLNPDFRGYGDSDHLSRITSPEDLNFIQDLEAALTFLQKRTGITDVTVVGHSFGAGVALGAAARDPRVSRIVAISPGRRVRGRVLGSLDGRRAIRDRMTLEMGIPEERFPLALVEPIVVPIIIDTYVDHPFRQPVLLVDGEREEAADLRFLRDAARRMKADTAYVTIPHAGHYFGVERQAEDRDPVTLASLVDVIVGWIRGGAGWARAHE